MASGFEGSCSVLLVFRWVEGRSRGGGGSRHTWEQRA